MSPRRGYDGEDLAHVTVRIRRSTHNRLLEIAAERDVSISRMVNSAIDRYLDALPPIDAPPIGDPDRVPRDPVREDKI
jgi:hypothetical protein